MKKSSLALLFAAAAACSASAVSLPRVFGNGMVLQRGMPLPVWGTGEPGEAVSVSFAGQNVSTTVGEDGKWKLFLAPLTASGTGAEFRVSGNDEKVFGDVVVGEVWYC